MEREPGVAVYRQIADELRKEIEEGVYPVGSLLPSQAALIGRYGVSQMTIRHAMQVLDEWGLVSRQQGRGTFVKAPDVHQASEEKD